MPDTPHKPDELTQEELERQAAEELPDREVMTVINPEPALGRMPGEIFPPQPDHPISE